VCSTRCTGICPALFDEVKVALRKAAAAHPGLRRRGVDTVGRRLRPGGPRGRAPGQPGPLPRRTHRGDARGASAGSPASGCTRSPVLQFLQFNTVYQLLAMSLGESPLLEVAETLLMMPDLFAWLLTAAASASGPTPRRPSCSTQVRDLIRRALRDLGCPGRILPESWSRPGTEIAPCAGGGRGARNCPGFDRAGPGHPRHGQRRRRGAPGPAAGPWSRSSGLRTGAT